MAWEYTLPGVWTRKAVNLVVNEGFTQGPTRKISRKWTRKVAIRWQVHFAFSMTTCFGIPTFSNAILAPVQ